MNVSPSLLAIRNWVQFARSRRCLQSFVDRPSRLARGGRLWLEALEDRTVLSAWVPKGPAPILGGTPGGDPTTGRIAGIAADPSDPNTVYIAAAGGGVWKTTDGGSDWTPLTDAQPTLFMGALALAPSDPTVLYAGTGEATNSSLSFYGRGVLKSTDAGATWTLLGDSSFDRRTISRIVVSPTDSNTVYVAVAGGGVDGVSGGTGIWKSTDGGISWVNTTTAISTTDSYTDLAVDPLDPLTLYAAVGSRRGSTVNGIYKTTNGGNTWSVAGNAPRGNGNGNTKLALAPTNDLCIYASITDPASGALSKMLKSTDGGVTWVQMTNTPNYMGAQGWYDSTLAVDPLSADTIYAGGAYSPNSIIRSQDAGATWTDIGTVSNGHDPHVDHHALAFDAAGRLLDGTDGGIWRLDNQNPVRWDDLNGNLSITQFVGIALHPTNPNIAYGGGQDIGTVKFTGAPGWKPNVVTSDGGFVRDDFNTPLTVYHTSQYALGPAFLQRSDNGGNNWASKTSGINLTDPADFYPPYVMDPSNSTRLLLGTNRVYETTNRADSWTPISAPDTAGWVGNATIDSLAVAPSDGNTIYASAGSSLFVTMNDGGSWSQRSIPGVGHIQDIEVDSSNSLIAYAVRDRFGGGKVFRTTDGGVTWSDISGNLPDLPAYTIAIGPGILYLGNDDGVYSSIDGGASWSRLGDGLPHAQVRELVLNMALGILAAGTHGRGLWELNVGGPATQLSVLPSTNAITAGTPFQITVTALDRLHNPATGYTGQIQFMSTDKGATLPVSYTFTAGDAGTHTFPVTLILAGSQTITVSDPASGFSATLALSVNPATANHFAVSAPPAAAAGSAVDVTVTALDSYNNVDVNYRGSVHFTTSDGSNDIDLPPDTTFTSADLGVHTFAAGLILVTAGNQVVGATDTISGISGQATVTVLPASPDHLLLMAADTVVSGTAFDVTVTVQDAFNNTVTGYLGTVQFLSTDSDPGVDLPPNYPFSSADAGSHTFAGGVTLITDGNQIITVSDPNLAIMGTATVSVVPPGLPPPPESRGGSAASTVVLFGDLGGILNPALVGSRQWEGIPLSNRAGEGIDLLRVHDLIIALEQPGDRRLVDLHFGIADLEGAITDNSVALGSLVKGLNSFDAERRHRV